MSSYPKVMVWEGCTDIAALSSSTYCLPNQQDSTAREMPSAFSCNQFGKVQILLQVEVQKC